MTGHQPELVNWFSETSHESHLHGSGFIDLALLDLNGVNTGRNIIDALLKDNALDTTIHASKEIDSKLFQLNLDHQNELKHSGFHTLNLGFPIIKLFSKKTKKTCFAPLFIWDIHLENTDYSKSTWAIKHKKTDSIRLNNALYRHIKQNYKIDLLKLSHPSISNKNLNTISLSKICYELSGALGKKEDLFLGNLQQVDQKSGNSILCAAVINNFSSSFQFSTPKKLSPKKTIELQHPFSTSTLDPYQEKAFQTIWQQTDTNIYASQGSGKSHLLHYTLINALSNGHKSLVIADSIDRIKKIRSELSAHGLDHLMLDISNPQKDLPKIVQALSYKSSIPKEDFDEPYFKYLINLCQRHKHKLDTSFKVLDQPIFDKTNWPDIVGEYLRYNRTEKKDLLDNQLHGKDFTFHPTEYLSLKEAVKYSEPLYRKINNLQHPLHKLHPDIFLEKKQAEAKAFVENQLHIFYKKFDQLHHRYILKQQDYSRDLNNMLDSFYQEILLKIEALKDMIEDNRMLYGHEFEDSGILQTGKLKVYGVFSDKHKKILKARSDINDQLKSIFKLLDKEPTYHFEVPENIDSKSISKVSNYLNGLEDQLFQWYEESPDQLQEELQRLNTKSVNSSLDYAEQINELEYTLEMNIEELNTSGLFHQVLQNKMLTIPMRQLFIQDIMDQLQVTLNQLDKFDFFYEWQRNWLLLPEIHRKVLRAIIKVNPKNWKIAFQSWYFYQRLKSDYHFKMPKNQEKLLAFESDIQKVRAILPIQIRQLWKQKAIKKKLHKEISKLSLFELIEQHVGQISQQFPILVVTNPVAAELFNQQNFKFDLAFLFSKNHLDRNEETTSFASAHRNIQFRLPSLGEQIKTKPINQLNNIHRETAQSLFNFTNQLFFENQRSLLFNSKTRGTSFVVEHGNGQFKNNTNTQEAETLIDGLFRLASKPENDIPKIAVVSSTIEQRNLIARKLIQRGQASTRDAEKLKKLQTRKLGIFCLKEQINGNYEQLFFSLGVHSFSQNAKDLLHYLNSKIGHQQLVKLLSANFQKIYLYHSLSDSELALSLSYKTKKTIRLFAAWIKYAKAYAQNETKEAQEVLESFSVLQESGTPHRLTHEIGNELIPFIGKNRIQFNSNIKGTRLPLVILPYRKTGNPIAILGDASIPSQSYQSHLWKIHFLKHLKKQGIEPIPVWSANWFENPALEARKLASYILKKDKA